MLTLGKSGLLYAMMKFNPISLIAGSYESFFLTWKLYPVKSSIFLNFILFKNLASFVLMGVRTIFLRGNCPRTVLKTCMDAFFS